MSPTHRRLASALTVALALGTADPAGARYDSNPPSWRSAPAASPGSARSDSGPDFPDAAIAAGGAGLALLAGGGALAVHRRRQRVRPHATA